MTSLPAQVMFAQPSAHPPPGTSALGGMPPGSLAVSAGGAMHHHPHAHPHPHSHPSHSHHTQHAMSPPPPPSTAASNVPYHNYLPPPGSDAHHAYAPTPPPYLQHNSERRLPSIRDLDFSFKQQHQAQQHSSQGQNQQTNIYSPHAQQGPQISPGGQPSPAGARPPPVVTSGPGMSISGPGMPAGNLGMGTQPTTSSGDITITPVRNRGHFRLPSDHPASQQQQQQQHHASSQMSPSLPTYVQPQGYPGARRQRGDSGHGHPMPHGRPISAGGSGMPLTSPISATGRSPLVTQPPYGYPTPHSSTNNPHSPYAQTFPSPHTPHHHLHTPSSLGPSNQATSTHHQAQQPHHQAQHSTLPPPQQQQNHQYEYNYGYGNYASVPAPPPGNSAYAPPQQHSQYAPEKIEQWSQPPATPVVAQSYHNQYTPQLMARQPSYGPPPTQNENIGRGSSTVPSGPAHAQTQVNTPMAAGPQQSQYVSASVKQNPEEEMKAQYIKKVQEHCLALYDFAKRYENSSAQPSQVELDDMARRAQEVVSLLAHIRRLARDGSGALPSPAPEELAFLSASGPSRGPKRSWGEIAGEEDEEAFSPTATRKNSGPVYQGGGDRGAKDERGWEGDGGDQLTGEPGGSAAEKDMALIRRKRASQQAPSNTPKGKYRKRSRASPPGKCHSCNIRETPEWRRGPDGARTLCNACGLHYAKLVRKREKARQANDAAASLANAAFGVPTEPDSYPEIDMETLRASTRAANERELAKADRERGRFHNETTSPNTSKTSNANGNGTTRKGQTSQEQGIGLGLVQEPMGHSSMMQNGHPDLTALGISTTGGDGSGDRPGTSGSNGAGAGAAAWRPYAEGQSSFMRGEPGRTHAKIASTA